MVVLHTLKDMVAYLFACDQAELLFSHMTESSLHYLNMPIILSDYQYTLVPTNFINLSFFFG